RRRQHPREVEQLVLVLCARDAREGTHLRVRELAPRERRVRQRQLRQAPRNAHVLPRGARRQCTAPRDPLRARAETLLRPAPAPVELRPPARASGRCRHTGAPRASPARPRARRGRGWPDRTCPFLSSYLTTQTVRIPPDGLEA